MPGVGLTNFTVSQSAYTSLIVKCMCERRIIVGHLRCENDALRHQQRKIELRYWTLIERLGKNIFILLSGDDDMGHRLWCNIEWMAIINFEVFAFNRVCCYADSCRYRVNNFTLHVAMFYDCRRVCDWNMSMLRIFRKGIMLQIMFIWYATWYYLHLRFAHFNQFRLIS